jgi:MarR-like DNA-binding transcriptional regulator SgrR of sgrS sRNA
MEMEQRTVVKKKSGGLYCPRQQKVPAGLWQEIRNQYQAGHITQKDLAERFGCSVAAIRNILSQSSEENANF